MLIFYVIAHFGHHVIPAIIVPLLPYIRSTFALSYAHSGLLVSALSVTYGIAQLPAGWLSDRLGPRFLIGVAIVGVALAGLGMGLSPSFPIVIVCLIAMGVMGGGYHPAAASLISMTFEPKRQGRALGVHLSGGSASYFLSPLIGVALASIWGWRGSYIGLSLVMIIFGVIFYLFIRTKEVSITNPQKKPRRRDESQEHSFSAVKLIPLLFLSSLTGVVTTSIIAFLPLLIVDHFGVSKESAAVWLAFFYSTGLWAAPLGGYISDRVGRVPVILLVCLLAGPAIYTIGVISYGLPLGILLVLLGMTLFIRMPVSEAYILNRAPVHIRSTVLGIYYFAGTEGSGILTPVMGSLIDLYGFSTTLTAASLVLIGAALITVLLITRVRFFKN